MRRKEKKLSVKGSAVPALRETVVANKDATEDHNGDDEKAPLQSFKKHEEVKSLPRTKFLKKTSRTASEEPPFRNEKHGSAVLREECEAVAVRVSKMGKKQKLKKKKQKLMEMKPVQSTTLTHPLQNAGDLKSDVDAEAGRHNDTDMSTNPMKLESLGLRTRKRKRRERKLEASSELSLISGPSPPETNVQQSSDAVIPVKKKKRKKLGREKTAAIAESHDDLENRVEVALAVEKTETSNASTNGDDSAKVLNDKPVAAADKYKEILGKLADVLDAQEARKIINEEVASGMFDQAEFMTIMQRYRQQKRKKVQAMQRDKVVEMEGTLDDVKRVVSELVRKNKLKPWEAGDIIKRWKNRERRRIGRQVSKQTTRACFHCREHGHVLADCPSRGDQQQAIGNVSSSHGDGICFKCGSTEHNVHSCPRKHTKGFPYATCFVCGQQGHLSKDCEQNAHGIYPDGGCCNVCGSTRHLKRDCPELAAQKQRKDDKKVKVCTMSAMSSADMDNISDSETPSKESKAKPKMKIVKF
ncbi:CCHC-type domain-containing protein [Trichostrongylus colubriformis]|uniref:CCHC-type domain-containing protein n=1 Tax=Trichostrongylus colubriformis TaxID=6319 RepID=A0AAN8FUC8_TRICO